MASISWIIWTLSAPTRHFPYLYMSSTTSIIGMPHGDTCALTSGHMRLDFRLEGRFAGHFAALSVRIEEPSSLLLPRAWIGPWTAVRLPRVRRSGFERACRVSQVDRPLGTVVIWLWATMLRIPASSSLMRMASQRIILPCALLSHLMPMPI